MPLSTGSYFCCVHFCQDFFLDILSINSKSTSYSGQTTPIVCYQFVLDVGKYEFEIAYRIPYGYCYEQRNEVTMTSSPNHDLKREISH